MLGVFSVKITDNKTLLFINKCKYFFLIKVCIFKKSYFIVAPQQYTCTIQRFHGNSELITRVSQKNILYGKEFFANDTGSNLCSVKQYIELYFYNIYGISKVGIGVTMENMKLSHICLNKIASCELEIMEMC